jgi:hypothetical protein
VPLGKNIHCDLVGKFSEVQNSKISAWSNKYKKMIKKIKASGIDS